MWQEFKEFAFKGNAFDLAVGVILGVAFGKIVDGIVNLLIMPVVGAMLGGLNFDNYFLGLSSSVTATNLVDAQKQGAVFGYGAFITILINFLIIAFILFQLVKVSNRMKRAEPPAPPPAATTTEVLLAEIRDALKNGSSRVASESRAAMQFSSRSSSPALTSSDTERTTNGPALRVVTVKASEPVTGTSQMSRRDELIAKYTKDLTEKCGVTADMDLLAAVTKGCGPTIYSDDASTVSAADSAEMDRVKKNFLMKKLGLTAADDLDGGIQTAIDQYGRSNRNKYRAVFYYLLVKHFKRESTYVTQNT
jgi:large conductance mechanosensitive channel